MLALVPDAYGGRGGIAQYNRDFLGAIGLQLAMADNADADFFLQVVLVRREEFEVFLVAVFHFERPDVAAATFEINFE